ncbi:hypothetical protein H4R19_000694 [Coemansia spiralis]|nr:hypothetical protein H4R19_000694 [Coemansia spiralis]
MIEVGTAQWLPGPIVAGIVRQFYLPTPARRLGTAHSYSQLEPLALLPVMAVCRAWREEACVHFNQVALVSTEKWTRSLYSHVPMPDLDLALEGGRQRHLRRLFVLCNFPEAEGGWEGDVCNAAWLVRRCGPVPLLREVYFEFAAIPGPTRFDGEHDLACRITGEFARVVGELAKAAPNVHRVSMGRMSEADWRTESLDIVRGAFRQAYNTVGVATTHLDIMSEGAIGYIGMCPPVDGLCSLVLHTLDQTRDVLDLIHRNAASLEVLCIECMSVWSMADLVIADQRPVRMVTYQQLRLLRIADDDPNRDDEARLAGVNPFPRLEMLRCPGDIQQTFAVTVLENSAQLHSLDMPLSADLVSRLGCGVLPALYHIGLNIYHLNEADVHTVAGHLRNVLELCPHVRSVELVPNDSNISSNNLYELHLPPAVQFLDASRLLLTPDMAANLLCACPQLLTARVMLKGMGKYGGYKALPTDKAVRCHRAWFRNLRPSVCSLDLILHHFTKLEQASEAALLLLDVLPRVSRVALAVVRDSDSYSYSYTHKSVLRGICHARSRSVYAAQPHLARIRFVGLESGVDW